MGELVAAVLHFFVILWVTAEPKGCWADKFGFLDDEISF